MALDAVWSGLIGRARALRKAMTEAGRAANSQDAAATRAFVRNGLGWAADR